MGNKRKLIYSLGGLIAVAAMTSLLINAHSDYLAYKLGLLQSSESFESTREHANITAKAKGNWHRDDFSALIRA